MPKIKPIPTVDSERLCSGQVITCIADAVKELVDNSIDADASNITIRLVGGGLDTIEVADDGIGIPESDFDGICLKYATSKITSFEDLGTVTSFGFRGEALSSIAALSECVRVLTKIEKSEIGFLVEFDRQAKIVKKMRRPRPRGTTITVQKLFSALPVRQKYFQNQVKSEVNKLLTMMRGYSLANDHLKISVKEGTEKKEIFQSCSSTGLQSKLQSYLKSDMSTVVIKRSSIRPQVAEEFGIDTDAPESDFIFDGVISAPRHGRSNTDLQFFSINSRPIDYPKLSKIINQVFRSCDPTGSSKQYPAIALNITVPLDKVDVNVTPDKRTIFVSNENLLFAIIKSSILNTFGTNTVSFEQTKYSLSSSQVTIIDSDERITQREPEVEARGVKRSLGDPSSKMITDFYGSTERPSRLGEIMDRFTTPASATVKPFPQVEFQKVSELVPEGLLQVPLIGAPPPAKPRNANPFLNTTATTDISVVQQTPTYPRQRRCSSPSSKRSRFENFSRSRSSSPPPFSGNSFRDRGRGDASNMTFEPRVTSSPNKRSLSTSASSSIAPSISRTTIEKFVDEEPAVPERRKVPFPCDLSRLYTASDSPNKEADLTQPLFTENLEIEDEKEAEEKLIKEMDKTDFLKMRIVGQFNQGFIITQIGSTYFVIDQHASDERRNFDELLASHEIDSQTLIKPIVLNLTPFEEHLVEKSENELQLFSKNGFKLKYDEDVPQGSRFSLIAAPVSGNAILGENEVQEIVNMLNDSLVVTKMMRPKAILDLLAMKACRKSIMIGTPMRRPEMEKLVSQMATTNSPWTCAHGRPTVRCLGNLSNLKKFM